MKRISFFMLPVLAVGFLFLSFKPQEKEVIANKDGIYSSKHDETTWVLNKNNSVISFSVSHLVVSTAEGVFKTFEGSLKSSRPDFSDAQISFSIDATSIDTDSESRDNHLRADEYFSVEKYPEILFESTSFKQAGGKKYTLSGNLTLKGVTKPVVFDVIYNGNDNKATFNCTTKINRYDYSLTAGFPAVGKEVTINAKVEMIKG